MVNYIGEIFGNYQLIQVLGRGGFAEVYLGQHIHIQTQAAIKVLSKPLGTTDLKQFLHEARTVAALDHPHIVRVFDFGLHDETPFLVMNYAPHGTVRQRHPRGSRVPLADVLLYAQQTALALQYAHDQKLIHRDVKPENMLLNSKNEVLLSDFGIAVMSTTTSPQQTKVPAGTVAYMAPEQITGKACPASDQYALGIVVYELLSGELPFQGSFFEICGKHLHAQVPSPRTSYPDLPLPIEQCIMKALAKEPEQRFSSVQTFAAALTAACLQQGHSQYITTPVQTLIQEEAGLGQNGAAWQEKHLRSALIEIPTTTGKQAEIPTQIKGEPGPTPVESPQKMPEHHAHDTPGIGIIPESELPAPTRTKQQHLTKGILLLFCLLLLAPSPFLFGTLLKPNPYHTNRSHRLFVTTTTHIRTQSVSTPAATATVVALLPTPVVVPTARPPLLILPTVIPTMQPIQPTVPPTQPVATTLPTVAPPTPTPVQRQLTSAPQVLSKTVNATGSIAAIQAQGNVTIWSKNQTTAITVAQGTIFTSNNTPTGVQVMVDETVTLPIYNPKEAPTPTPTTVLAHVVQPGASGNMAANSWSVQCCTADQLYACNTTAFSGGQNAVQIVQQSDVDGAAGPLKNATTQHAQDAINSQLHPKEHLVGNPTCTSTVTANPEVNTPATTVTVTVQTICTATAST